MKHYNRDTSLEKCSLLIMLAWCEKTQTHPKTTRMLNHINDGFIIGKGITCPYIMSYNTAATVVWYAITANLLYIHLPVLCLSKLMQMSKMIFLYIFSRPFVQEPFLITYTWLTKQRTSNKVIQAWEVKRQARAVTDFKLWQRSCF